MYVTTYIWHCIVVYCFVYRSVNFDVMHYLFDFV